MDSNVNESYSMAYNSNEICVQPESLNTLVSLQWRHNERDGVSNHQPRDCLLNGLFRPRSKKTSKLRTGLCEGNSPVTGILADVMSPLVGKTEHYIQNSGDVVNKVKDLEAHQARSWSPMTCQHFLPVPLCLTPLNSDPLFHERTPSPTNA